MTARRMRYRVVVGFVASLLGLAVDVRAQDVLARAKQLYLSAAYDEALVLLEQLKSQPSAPTPEVEQYRVFCLLALQRSDDARKAIEEIVTADPFYHPSETLTSPRIRAVFQETRKALLPDLVQRTYAAAKASFEKKDPQALAQFEQVLALMDDPDVNPIPQLSDLRTVVTGFRDLSKAMATSARPVPAQKSPEPAVPVLADTPAAATVPLSSPARPNAEGPFGFVPPVVISQPLPRWSPPKTVDARTGFKGLIEVTIDENGSVTSATLQQSVHPLYDEKLLAIARTWKYKPATRNGVPTPSLKVVEIRLQPAR